MRKEDPAAIAQFMRKQDPIAFMAKQQEQMLMSKQQEQVLKSKQQEPPKPKSSEFSVKLIKNNFLEKIATSSSFAFDLSQINSYLLIDETKTEEIPICVCKKPYRGEIAITCESCGKLGHPRCLGLPENINVNAVKWKCPNCVGPPTTTATAEEAFGMAMSMGMGMRPELGMRPDMGMRPEMGLRPEMFAAPRNLIGKRPNDSFSEEEPNLAKRMNLSGFPGYFY